MNEETRRVLELEYIILESFTKIRMSLDELQALAKVDTIPATLTIRQFAMDMLVISKKLAEQHDNRLMVDDLLRDLKKENEDDQK